MQGKLGLEKIKYLIEENLVLEALEELSNSSKDEELQFEVVLLKSQYTEVVKNRRLNLLSQDEIDIRLTRIKYAVLSLAFKYASMKRTVKNAKSSRDVAAGLLKRGLKMKKRFEKDFVERGAFQKYGTRLAYEPDLRFAYHEVIIRDVTDETYPNIFPTDKMYSPRFKSYLYDFYHKGVELWLSAGSYATVLVDKNYNWQHLYDTDKTIPNDLNLRVLKCDMYGRMPFYNIIDYNLDGDMYDNVPHIFTNFNLKDDSPFESYIFRKFEGSRGETMPFELDEAKMKAFVE